MLKRFGGKTSLEAPQQLMEIFITEYGHKPTSFTNTGKPKADDEALSGVRHLFVKEYLKLKKTYRALTYLSGIQKETVDGFLHPFFNLSGGSNDDRSGPKSYRSCVAKGTMIEVVRDLSEHPYGIPIEKVKEGDYVYCYDNNLKLRIRKVSWAGKTGCRKVIRIRWASCRGERGFLDLTPDHEIRFLNGEYIRADRIKQGDDFRTSFDNKHTPKRRVLAMARYKNKKDLINQTGREDPIYDHRLIYSELVGDLKDNEVVHHKDNNHYNNTPSNLEKHTPSSHAKLHGGPLSNPIVRERAYKTRVLNLLKYGYTGPKGPESKMWIHLSKIQMLRMLSSVGGKVTQIRNQDMMDFNSFKRKAKLYGINLKIVKDRYDIKGRYISRGRLKKACRKGIQYLKKWFGSNHYKAYRQAKQRGFKIKKYVERIDSLNNHKIIGIEYLDQKVDVYDIEVEEFHNFIANEICVHNCSQMPNFQNIPTRLKWVSELIRPCFIARKDHILVEVDYSGIEVRIAACYHKDPTMLTYIKDPTKDMHRDMAVEIFGLSEKQVSKDARYVAKNGFVFPAFYGSYYKQIAPNIWKMMDQLKLKIEGSETPLKDHLRNKFGIKELGACDHELDTEPGTFEDRLQKIERNFWDKRFPVYAKWKKTWYESYQKSGGFDFLTGFRVSGFYKRNEVLNLGIQGSAFHCLLWSLIQLQKWLEDTDKQSLIVGQIHDSLILDVYLPELQMVLNTAKRIMTKDLLEAWKWIIVPLDVEVEVCPKGGNWFQKEKWEKKGKVWEPK